MSLIESKAATYRDILSGLSDLDGVSRILMWQLRDANGNDRLGVNVNADIQAELERRGIGCTPALRNQTQWDTVRLYLKDSHIGRLIDAITEMSEDADGRLASAAQCADTVTRIKRLVAA